MSMYGTKVEIKLKKAEPGAWSKLYVQKMVQDPVENKSKGPVGDRLAMQVEAVDLDDL